MSQIQIVPVSGGKDSQVVLDMIVEQYPIKQIRVVHQNTGYDHPLTYQHLSWISKHYGVKIEHTRSEKYKDIFDLIEQVGYFPGQVARVCTSRLKQMPFAEWLRAQDLLGVGVARIHMGMRRAESRTRKTKYADIDSDQILYLPDISSYYDNDFRHVEVVLPIVEMQTFEVFAYLQKRKLKINPLYAKGHSRVGCYPCLLANNMEWKLAAVDKVGRAHMQHLVQIQTKFREEGNPRKLARRIHPTRDVEDLLKKKRTLFPIFEEGDDDACGWCSI